MTRSVKKIFVKDTFGKVYLCFFYIYKNTYSAELNALFWIGLLQKMLQLASVKLKISMNSIFFQLKECTNAPDRDQSCQISFAGNCHLPKNNRVLNIHNLGER